MTMVCLPFAPALNNYTLKDYEHIICCIVKWLRLRRWIVTLVSVGDRISQRECQAHPFASKNENIVTEFTENAGKMLGVDDLARGEDTTSIWQG
jgi:hypothetical protein